MGSSRGSSQIKMFVAVGVVAVAIIIFLLSRRDRRTPEDPRLTVSEESADSGPAVIRRADPPPRPVSSSGPRATARSHAPSDEPTTITEMPEDPDKAEHPYVSEDLLGLDDSYEPEVVFKEAAQEFGVPSDLLKAVAYVESQGNHGHGVKTEDGGFGVMRLRENTESNTLDEAARLLGTGKKELVRDPAQNIRGAAALIKAYHDEALRSGKGTNPWLVAITLYSGRSPEQALLYGREIENILQEGLTHTTDGGQLLYINPGQHLLIASGTGE